jgi:nucleoside-diphosphate-sugar epimerase
LGETEPALKSLVIGGQGFIGAEIVRMLLTQGADVTVADAYADRLQCQLLFGADAVAVERADILDAAHMLALTRGMDSVYHLAGKLGTSELDDEVVVGIQTNVVGAVNVFDACVKNGVPRVFYPSKPNVWLNTYTITKVAAEQFAQLYSTVGSTVICSLRYFNAYGPGQKTGPVRKIVPSFAQRAMRGLPIEIFGSGNQAIDMIYAPDLGRITVEFTNRADTTEPIDCGRGVKITVNEVADAVNAYFGNKAPKKYLEMRRGETPDTHLVADIAPLRRVLPELTFSDLETSLETTLQWYADRESESLEATG